MVAPAHSYLIVVWSGIVGVRALTHMGPSWLGTPDHVVSAALWGMSPSHRGQHGWSSLGLARQAVLRPDLLLEDRSALAGAS